MTTAGTRCRVIDVERLLPATSSRFKLSGVTVGPASVGAGTNLYITDRGDDFNPDTTDPDGKVYEIDVAPTTCGPAPAPTPTPIPGAPDTTITSGPSGVVDSTSAQFSFTGTSGTTSFQCQRDGSAWTACASPVTYTGLSEGTHTFAVRAVSAGGTDPTPATRSWTIQVGDTAGGTPFTDIDGNQFENDIIWLYNAGITGGCTTDRFCPSSNVLRDQMASFLDRALDLPATTVDFFDDDDGNIHEGAINRLAAAGITGGCDVRQYCPKSNVLRDQMASFLVRAFNLPLTATDYFGDDEGNLHENQINALANSGITGGCGPGRYCPTNPVTRGQMAAFLHRALD
jgi:hypothetical protein